MRKRHGSCFFGFSFWNGCLCAHVLYIYIVRTNFSLRPWEWGHFSKVRTFWLLPTFSKKKKKMHSCMYYSHVTFWIIFYTSSDPETTYVVLMQSCFPGLNTHWGLVYRWGENLVGVLYFSLLVVCKFLREVSFVRGYTQGSVWTSIYLPICCDTPVSVTTVPQGHQSQIRFSKWTPSRLEVVY